MKKSELKEIFEAIVRLLAENKAKYTLVLDNSGSTRGQLYHVCKATKAQVLRGTSTVVLFIGTAKEVGFYLRGIRDTIKELQ